MSAGLHCRNCAERGDRLCSTLGSTYTPTDPERAKSPLLNEPAQLGRFSAKISARTARLWNIVFQVRILTAISHTSAYRTFLGLGFADRQLRLLNGLAPGLRPDVTQQTMLIISSRRLYPTKEELGDLPDLIVPGAGNGEFIVTKERVLLRPRGFYATALNVFHVSFARLHAPSVIVVHVTCGLVNPVYLSLQTWPKGRSQHLGFAFEALWHRVFGEPYVQHAVSKCDLYVCRLAKVFRSLALHN